MTKGVRLCRTIISPNSPQALPDDGSIRFLQMRTCLFVEKKSITHQMMSVFFLLINSPGFGLLCVSTYKHTPCEAPGLQFFHGVQMGISLLIHSCGNFWSCLCFTAPVSDWCSSELLGVLSQCMAVFYIFFSPPLTWNQFEVHVTHWLFGTLFAD